MISAARQTFSPKQISAIILLAIFLWLFFIFNFNLATLIGIGITSIVFLTAVIFRSYFVIKGLRHNYDAIVTAEELKQLDESSLPTYTILLPAYREDNVIEKLIESIKALDYPTDKLDVKILLEIDDEATINHLKRLNLPTYFETIIVPDSLPKTKPKTCNVGLAQARGEFLVIYDAEDIPDLDQLKKAIVVFNRIKNEKVVCLQAKLNFYNPRQNVITKLFTLDYTAWFDIYLPGLYAINSPMPLGGTSNHFRTKVLQEIGGWDPYNVTEDCDLGLRIAQHKLMTMVLDSTTWEEATPTVKAWTKQRTRWMKGFMQTYLIHTRPFKQQIENYGLIKFIKMNLVLGLQIITTMFTPTAFLAIFIWLYRYWPLAPRDTRELIVLIFAIVMFSFNFFFIAINMIAGYKRKNRDLIIYALLMPIYWIFIGLASWRAFFQLFLQPFFWEKTQHGLSHKDAQKEVKLKTGLRALAYKKVWYINLGLYFIATFIFVIIILIPGSQIFYNTSLQKILPRFKTRIHLEQVRVPEYDPARPTPLDK